MAEGSVQSSSNQPAAESSTFDGSASGLPRMRFLIAGVSVVSLIGVMAFTCFLGVYYCRRTGTSRHSGSSFTNVKAVNAPPPRSITQSTSNLINGYSILHSDTPTQKRADMLSLRSSGFSYTQHDGLPKYTTTTTVGVSSSSQPHLHRNYSERSILETAAGYSNSLRLKDLADTGVVDSLLVDSTSGGFYGGRQISVISETACGCSHEADLNSGEVFTPPPPPYFMQSNHNAQMLPSPIAGMRSPAHNTMLRKLFQVTASIQQFIAVLMQV